MRFSIAAVLALATSLVAANPTPGFHPITKPTEGEEVPAGSTYEIVWEPSAAHPGKVTIGLLGGASPGTLDIVDTIAKGVDGSAGSYSWSIPADLGKKATYGIMITLESDTTIFQYGFPFKIVGGSSSGSTTGTASETETATETSAGTTETGSSSSATSTSSSASSTITVSSSTLTSSTIHGNWSTTAQTTITSLTTVVPSTTTRTGTSSIATNGVASVAAGSFAMLGGVAMAVLAL